MFGGKKIVGKKFRHFLPASIFAWLSENINCIKKH